MRGNSSKIWAVALIWAALIFATSCTFIERSVFILFVERFLPSGVPRSLWLSFWQSFGLIVVKTYHMAEFALLFTLLFWTLRSAMKWTRAAQCSAIACVCYAALDEWHQTFVPGRGGTPVDVIIDCCGITLAAALIARLMRRKQN